VLWSAVNILIILAKLIFEGISTWHSQTWCKFGS